MECQNSQEIQSAYDKSSKAFVRQKSSLNSLDLGFDRQLSEDNEHEREGTIEKV